LLWSLLGADYVLFGEWLWSLHSVPYNTLPDYFIAFDILEKKTGKFLSYTKVQKLLEGKIQLVPLLWEGKVTTDLPTKLNSLIIKSKFGDDKAEGVYLRIESDEYVIHRFKMRRESFKPGEHFGEKVNILKS